MRPGSLIALLCTLLVACGGDGDRPAGTGAPRAQATPTATAPQEQQAEEGEPVRAQGGARVSSVATGLDAPWEIAFLPDDRALITERPGRVRLLSADLRLQRDPVAEVPVTALGEGGLLGLAVDPAFERGAPFVYLYRTVEDGNEVVRFRMAGDRLREEAVVARGIAAAQIHNGGRLRFGPDDRLYFSTGDAADDASAQTDGLNGKILRLDRAQYRGARPAAPEMFSTGHRNPQGFAWQPRTDRFIANEHGPDGDDEVNVIQRGANYGWPTIRGTDEADGLRSPIAVYADSIAPSGSTFVRRGGSSWSGDYLMAGLVGQRLQRLTIADDGRVVRDEPLFEGQYGRMRTVVEGPDGALYALTNNTDGRGSPQDGDDRLLRIVPPALAPREPE